MGSTQNDREAHELSLPKESHPVIMLYYSELTTLVPSNWEWADGNPVPMPSASWHDWYEGQPDNSDISQQCAILTNYKFWSGRIAKLEQYYWRDYGCTINPQQIQGYICERELE